MDMVLVKNANRMMTTATLLDDGIELGFADGIRGLIPYAEVPEIKTREAISGLELPNPYWSCRRLGARASRSPGTSPATTATRHTGHELVLQTAGGESVEIPWDFARHYCDASYRPTVEAMATLGRKTIGERVRRFRESAGLTQTALARTADIGRVTLVRLEHGEQSPRFKTLKAVADALGVDAPDLLVEPEFQRR